MGAGDQLRTVYHQFSNGIYTNTDLCTNLFSSNFGFLDQNSLANLDQDLPNYLQNAVPIFSLPQHWLWCETWCDDASKEKAKTIDLVCQINKPFTTLHAHRTLWTILMVILVQQSAH